MFAGISHVSRAISTGIRNLQMPRHVGYTRVSDLETLGQAEWFHTVQCPIPVPGIHHTLQYSKYGRRQYMTKLTRQFLESISRNVGHRRGNEPVWARS